MEIDFMVWEKEKEIKALSYEELKEEYLLLYRLSLQKTKLISLLDVAGEAGMLPAHDKLKQLGFKGKGIS